MCGGNVYTSKMSILPRFYTDVCNGVREANPGLWPTEAEEEVCSLESLAEWVYPMCFPNQSGSFKENVIEKRGWLKARVEVAHRSRPIPDIDRLLKNVTLVVWENDQAIPGDLFNAIVTEIKKKMPPSVGSVGDHVPMRMPNGGCTITTANLPPLQKDAKKKRKKHADDADDVLPVVIPHQMIREKLMQTKVDDKFGNPYSQYPKYMGWPEEEGGTPESADDEDSEITVIPPILNDEDDLHEAPSDCSREEQGVQKRKRIANEPTSNPKSKTTITKDGEGKKKAKRPKKDSNAPKRPANIFILFNSATAHAIKQQNPSATVSEVAKLASEQWKAMSEEQKQPYKDAYNQNNEKFKNDMKAYELKKQTAVLA